MGSHHDNLVRKPKTQRGKRFLENRAPKLIENTKQTLFVKGGRTSDVVTTCLKDLCLLKKPHVTTLKRKNPFAPFDDETPIEKFGGKYDASFFTFGSHSKKRPHNIIFGRMFDGHVLDMVEFGIDGFVALKDMSVPSCSEGSKPCLMFSGDEFQKDPTFQRIKNLFIDYFRGEEAKKIQLQGLDHVITFTVLNKKIYMRVYRIILKKSASRLPRVELAEMGPRLNLTLRRTRLASADLFKQAMKVPEQTKTKKVKNVTHDVFGTKMGRIHVGKQDLGGLQTRKVAALRAAQASGDEQAAEDAAEPRIKKSRVERIYR